MSESQGIVDEMLDLTGRSVKFGVRLFGLVVNTSCRLFCATVEGITEALMPRDEIEVEEIKEAEPPKEEIGVEPPKKEIEKEEERKVAEKLEEKK